MMSDQYEKTALKILKALLAKSGKESPSRKLPLPTENDLDFESTDECGPDLISCYLQIVGCLRQAITLGRIDNLTDVVILLHFKVASKK